MKNYEILDLISNDIRKTVDFLKNYPITHFHMMSCNDCDTMEWNSSDGIVFVFQDEAREFIRKPLLQHSARARKVAHSFLSKFISLLIEEESKNFDIERIKKNSIEIEKLIGENS